MSLGEPPPLVSSTYQQLPGSRTRSSDVEPVFTSSMKPPEPAPHSFTTSADAVARGFAIDATLSAGVGSGHSIAPSLEAISWTQPTKANGSTSCALRAQARLARVFMICPREVERRRLAPRESNHDSTLSFSSGPRNSPRTLAKTHE